MVSFGKCSGGGRRGAQRSPALLPALLMTVARSQSVVLVNVSGTGARLRGPNLPAAGDDLLLKIDAVEVFGTVQWATSDLCGLAFDRPLPEAQVARLRAEAKLARLTKLTPEERLAMQDWTLGLAR